MIICQTDISYRQAPKIISNLKSILSMALAAYLIAVIGGNYATDKHVTNGTCRGINPCRCPAVRISHPIVISLTAVMTTIMLRSGDLSVPVTIHKPSIYSSAHVYVRLVSRRVNHMETRNLLYRLLVQQKDQKIITRSMIQAGIKQYNNTTNGVLTIDLHRAEA